ncbi:lactate dehydrogenase [Jannaschia pagri]|uniref:Lactate dehydrogenase n=1 Tax=Jannaschia pagri TaxID=2829797 RepID=A0ABQ4NLU1_9RHOB|nr:MULTISPECIES: 2-hydroxyacid dehydrogenase [unclassified Jannaschia]GIT91549.1 lactate dehydrogenase [Jannaschia sp. AI_61]GIT95383.1 lactate dehydrogenase [Jannaschia sp. AI_62]
MRMTVFSSKPYDKTFLSAHAERDGHDLRFLEARLTPETVRLAEGSEAICAFVNDDLSAPVLEGAARVGVRLIALRSAGFNNVDLRAAARLGVSVARVPAYSPHAVAEHAMALILALNRRIHRAYARVREGNFELDGLMGVDLYRKTAAVVGTGEIGTVLAKILRGFGCDVIAFDPSPSAELQALGVRYVDLPELFGAADVIALQCPLTPQTHHLIDDTAIAQMKPGVILVNTSRGAVVDTRAVIRGLKSRRIGALALDVYEEEGDLFFEDLSDRFIPDDVFARLLTFPNVLITGHQGFFTQEALDGIAQTTLGNLSAFAQDGRPLHPVVTPDA